jgi:hypothetical protein
LLLLLAVLGAAVPPAAQAAPLNLQLDESAFKQQSAQPRFIDFGRPTNIGSQQLEIISTDGFPVPLRGRCWTVAGGYGLSTVFAAMSGILTDAFSRNNEATRRNPRTAGIAIGLGALAGLIPGALLGSESRKEEASLARGVITLLDVGGTLALGIALNQAFSSKPLF